MFYRNLKIGYFFAIIFIIIFITNFIHISNSTFAQNNTESLIETDFIQKFYIGKVTKIIEEGESIISEGWEAKKYQILKVIIPHKDHDEIIDIKKGDYQIITEEQILAEGDQVVLSRWNGQHMDKQFHIEDRYRIYQIISLIIIFIIIVIYIARLKGLLSLIGLGFSITVISLFIIPQIIAGKNPLLISFLGSILIVSVSMYLSHGFRLRTSIALLSTLITFFMSVGFAYFATEWTNLYGIGNESAVYLSLEIAHNIDLRGILLAGIIIGTLGVLDDITTTQCAVVEELKIVNPSLSFKELYCRGMSVGKEHIASMINTLALAYVGSAMSSIILIFYNTDRPLWLILNSPFISEEIVRTLVGSISLVLASPISTLLAAYYFGKYKIQKTV